MTERAVHRGLGVSPGIAVGRVLKVADREVTLFQTSLPRERLAAEKARLAGAAAAAAKQLEAIKEKTAAAVGPDYAQIFDAHLLFLSDPAFLGRIGKQIDKDCSTAEWAVQKVSDDLLATFAKLGDEYIRERGADVEDVRNRLLLNLSGGARDVFKSLSEDVIVVARSLSPSDTAMLHSPHVVGFITDLGGATSHTAIIAKALEIPAVVGLHDFAGGVSADATLAIDGATGEVIVNPGAPDLADYAARRLLLAQREADYLLDAGKPALTADGERIALRANLELEEEISPAKKHGAEGVGLYRSEFLFLKHSPNLPSEQDHFEIYDVLAAAFHPQPVTIRTLDLGGEKYFHSVLDHSQRNPVLGLRAIRFCLKRPDLFKSQLRGILRASHRGNLKVMFPLITTVDELRAAKALLEECKTELRAEGVPFDEKLPVGIMIEVPSAVLIAEFLAKECEFFAIGTNDLISYLLAIDRGNEEVGYLYSPFHPAVLRALKSTFAAAAAANIPVSLCGEIGADPACAEMLLGLGLKEFSMHPFSIPAVKDVILKTHLALAKEKAAAAMTLPTAAEVEAHFRGHS